jgi:hypothetical protein
MSQNGVQMPSTIPLDPNEILPQKSVELFIAPTVVRFELVVKTIGLLLLLIIHIAFKKIKIEPTSESLKAQPLLSIGNPCPPNYPSMSFLAYLRL